MRKVLLLTNPNDATALVSHLSSTVPGLAVEWVQTLTTLLQACVACAYDARVIAYQTPVIVPASLLDCLLFPAYNFHPGPPTFPGSAPDAFAVYEGATRYGATVHEMAKRVDSGPIVAVSWFDVPLGIGRMALARMARKATFELFQQVAPQIVMAEAPLAALPDMWSGQKRTSRDFASLCQLPGDIDDCELQRRYRAFGEGPTNPLRLNLHGFNFVMDKHDLVDGYLDGIFQGTICGWAKLRFQDHSPLLVRIIIDEQQEIYTMAQDFRQDVRDAGYGDGNSGFSVPIPQALCDGLYHTVHTCLPDHAEVPLAGSPANFLFPRTIRSDLQQC